MSVPPSVLDAGIPCILHWTQVQLASITLVEFLSLHALQMLLFLDFYMTCVCMLSLYLFTAT